MENSSTRPSSERVVESLLAELSEERMRREIDDPIDAAAAILVRTPGPVRSQAAFLDQVTRLVQHIYAYGLSFPRRLSWIRARAEAIAILEHAYRSAHLGGYEAALLDATGPGDQGIELVLTRLTEIIKATERQQRVRRICADYLTGCSWGERCAIACELVARLWQFLPGDVRRLHRTQLADEVPVLVEIHQNTERWLADICAGVSFLTDPCSGFTAFSASSASGS